MKLQRLGRQERTRQAEVAMAASLRGGNKLSEFWFPLKAGGKAMNTRQVRDYVWRAHEQERWSDVLDCAVAMEPMLASGEFGDAERHNILGEFAQAHSVDRNWEAAGKCCERQVEILGTLQRFKDQGAAICRLAVNPKP